MSAATNVTKTDDASTSRRYY